MIEALWLNCTTNSGFRPPARQRKPTSSCSCLYGTLPPPPPTCLLELPVHVVTHIAHLVQVHLCVHPSEWEPSCHHLPERIPPQTRNKTKFESHRGINAHKNDVAHSKAKQSKAKKSNTTRRTSVGNDNWSHRRIHESLRTSGV